MAKKKSAPKKASPPSRAKKPSSTKKASPKSKSAETNLTPEPTAANADPAPKVGLLDLPGELRNAIYDLAFPLSESERRSLNPIKSSDNSLFTTTQRFVVGTKDRRLATNYRFVIPGKEQEHALLRVSKQIRKEAQQYYYSSFSFWCEVKSMDFAAISWWMGYVHSINMSQHTRLAIDMNNIRYKKLHNLVSLVTAVYSTRFDPNNIDFLWRPIGPGGTIKDATTQLFDDLVLFAAQAREDKMSIDALHYEVDQKIEALLESR